MSIFKNKSVFIVVLLSYISFLGMQPFGDFFRGVLYAIGLLYSLIFLFVNIKSLKCYKSPLFILTICFYVYSTLMLIIHQDIMDVGFAHIQIFVFTLIGMLELNEDPEKEMTTVLKTLAILGIIMSIGSLIELYLPESTYPYVAAFSKKMGNQIQHQYSRIDGLGLNANITSYFCAFGGIASFTLLLRSKHSIGMKVFHIFNIILSFYMVFIKCATRTSMISMLLYPIILLICLLLTSKNPNTRKMLMKIVIAGIAFVAVFALIVLLVPSVNNFFMTRIVRVASLKTGSGRLALWSEFLGRVKEKPLFGVPRHSLSFESCHNAFFDILTFTGVIGLAMYLVHFFSATFIFGKKMLHENDNKISYALCAFTMMLTIFVQNQTEWFIFVRYNIMALLTAYLIGLSVRIQNSKEN